MKKGILPILLFCVFSNCKLMAQERVLGEIDYPLLEKYIQSAKDHYLPKKIIEKQADGAKTAIAVTTVSYFDIFNASYIYRPSNNTAILTPGVTGNPYAVNGLQFGVNLNLGSLLQKPFLAKKAKVDYEIAKLNVQEYNNTLEIEVKSRYYNYIQQIAQLKLSAQNLQDITLISENIKRRFEKTEVTIDVYDQSRVSLTEAKITQLNVEVALQKAKDQLEQIIGVKLSEIH